MEDALSQDFKAGIKGEPHWLTQLRSLAWKKYLAMPTPQLKYGLSIRTDIKHLDFEKLPALVAGQKLSTVVENPNPSVVVMPFDQALMKYEKLVKQYLFNIATKEDKFSLFHRALFRNGWLVYVPKGVIAKPVRIRHEISSDAATSHTLIILESGSQLDVIESFTSEKGIMGTAMAEAVADDNSRLTYFGINKLSSGFTQFRYQCGVAHRDAAIDWFMADLGGKLTRSETSTRLAGEGASTQNLGMFFGTGSQAFDLTSNAFHLAPHTISDMLTRGALDDKATSTYNGMVKIYPNASNCNGFQREDTLLLSPDTDANAIPHLEIDNNDVRCTHAASTSQVDREQLFYLMSRGLPEKQAVKLIVKGFFERLLQRVKLEEMKKTLRADIYARIR